MGEELRGRLFSGPAAIPNCRASLLYDKSLEPLAPVVFWLIAQGGFEAGVIEAEWNTRSSAKNFGVQLVLQISTATLPAFAHAPYFEGERLNVATSAAV
jgi:hypothetical protein